MQKRSMLPLVQRGLLGLGIMVLSAPAVAQTARERPGTGGSSAEGRLATRPAAGPATQPSRMMQEEIASRLRLVPEGWVVIAYDFDRDGEYDAVEEVYSFDMEQARTRSQARRQQDGQRMAGPSPGREGRGERPGEAGRGTLRVQGRIMATRLASFHGHDHDHLLARIRLRDGGVAMVDLGPADEFDQVDLRPGEQISLVARRGRINGRPALLAEQIRTEQGQMVQIDLLEDQEPGRLRGTPVSPGSRSDQVSTPETQPEAEGAERFRR